MSLSVLLARVALALAGIATAVLPGVAAARAAFVHTQSPGYYRMMLGDYEVTALLDGTHPFAANELLIDVPSDSVHDLLKQDHLASPVSGSINAFLVNTGDRLVLIDTGAGPLYGTDGGFLVQNMRAAGYRPEDVDDILLTHLHRDHVGGLLHDGQEVFPNAVIHVSKTEADFWLDPANEAKVPPLLLPMFSGAMESLKPYIAAGRLKTFDNQGQVLPGFTATPAPGHSPGHTLYLVQSQGQKLLAWGDIVHVAAVQLAEPEASIRYDINNRQAEQERQAVFSQAAREGYWIAAAHISFPGLGHLRKQGNGYAWIPINYTRTP